MKALFLGLGSIGQRHLRLWKGMAGARALALRSGFGPPMSTDSYEPVSSVAEAAAAGATVAFICNPTSLHIDSALQCAACSMDLFIEKPIGNRRNGWEELKTLVRQRQLVTYVGYVLRFHPVVRRVKELLVSGRLGRIYSSSACTGSYLPAWRAASDYRHGYSARKDLGGGVLLDLSHEIDYLTWLFGPIRTMSGQLAQVSDLEIGTEDHADVLVQFETGVQGSVHLDYYRRPACRDLEVVGTQGILWADLLHGELELSLNGTTIKEMHVVDQDRLYTMQLEYFLKCLRNRTEPMNSLMDAENLWLRLLDLKEMQDERAMHDLRARGL